MTSMADTWILATGPEEVETVLQNMWYMFFAKVLQSVTSMSTTKLIP